MLDMILSIIVVVSVLVVGLLISIGNERQRKAMEGVRESLRAWAMNDLKIKRAREERSISINHPIEWLEEKAGIVLGYKPKIRDSIKVVELPSAIEAETGDGDLLVFSPIEPKTMRKLCRNNRGQKSLLNENFELLGKNPGKAAVYELSTLNAGVFFDIEMTQVWMILTGAALSADRIWVYVVEG
ncbi:MAG: hypothetical protein JXA25_19260 [Anaerolineales bacterium]|nr:hypothetical protein [Anaerolineales bacterium]